MSEMNMPANGNEQHEITNEPTELSQEAARKAFVMPEMALRGTIELFEPLLSKDKQVTQLHYDFSKLNGNDLIECLDTDPMVDTGKQISHVQARALFARACGKVERGISGLDEHDIMQRVGARDMVACARAGRVFFAYALGGALLSTYAV